MAKENLTKSVDIQVRARELDFVTRFATNWAALREIMGIMRPIRKAPGTTLKSKKASVVLQTGAIAEGMEIPYSKASVVETPYAEMSVEKWAKAVSIEAIKDHGYDVAVGMTDKALMNELQRNVMGRFYSYLLTGSLTGSASTFQKALAVARGKVLNAFKEKGLDVTEVVGFANINDFYAYLGDANITVQTQFGLTYVKDFLGYRVIILGSDSEIPQGKVVAVPMENIVLYYVDPSDSEFARAGLSYTVAGETPLVGFHTQGNYNNAVSECFALMGMVLFAEYVDGIAVWSIGSNSEEIAVDFTIGASTNLLGKVVGDLQENMSVANNELKGTLKHVTGYTGFSGEPYNQEGNFLAVHITAASGDTIKAGLVGGASGLVTLDEDGILVAKVGSNSEVLKVVATDGTNTETKLYSLSGLVLK